MSTRAYHRWTGILLLCSACNLPGISINSDPSTPSPVPVEQVCEPNARRCTSGNTLQVCAPDGSDFEVRVCQDDQTCSSGACLAIENTCSSGQPFSFSTRAIAFDVRADYKAQTAAVVIQNCGVREISLEQIVVRSPDRPDGDPAFSLSTPFVQRVRVAPQTSYAIGVTYNPSPGLTQVVGTLDLGITSDSFGRYTVPLSTRAVCATATPVTRLGIVQDTKVETIWFQNCGTEPMEISEVTASSVALTPFEKLPVVVAPGRHLQIEVRPPETLGPVQDTVEFRSKGAVVAKTQVHGFVAEPDCVPFEIGDFEVDRDVGVRSSVVLRPSALEPGTAPFFESIDRPGLSHTWPVSHGSEAQFKPDIVGTYRIDARAVSATQVSCSAVEAIIDATPDVPYLVEVQWENVGDLIPDDAGPGRGVNLDLHVVVRDGQGSWLSDSDCSSENQSCAENSATMVSSSLAGERPESVVVTDEDHSFDVGVHLANPYNFAGAQATVRVWANGELVEEATRLLLTANEFWWLGRWDADDADWTVVDSVFDGVPR
ncbi:MAG: hypothetical protein R3E66_07105 [bacterium]